MRGMLALLLGLAVAGPCAAEVKSHNAQGFVVVDTVQVNTTPAKAYAGLEQIGRWWDSQHTLSGDAANLSLQTHIGGCFCEALKDGGAVGWMLVVLSQPDHLLRLRGALGPLQAEGADGIMTWTFKPAPAGVEVALSYAVGGFPRANAEDFAAPVDMVLGHQLARYKAYLEAAAPAR